MKQRPLVLLLLQYLFVPVSSFRSSILLQPPIVKSIFAIQQAEEEESIHENHNATSRARRRLLLMLGVLLTQSSILVPTETNALDIYDTSVDNDDDSVIVYQLDSGIQFRNLQKGSGPLVNSDETSKVIVMHLKAMTSNGVELFDTKKNKASPILYQLESRKSSNLVTPGVEEAILSRGKPYLVKQNGVIQSSTKQQKIIQPMREGGKRRVIVPSSLAYGYNGVSRFDAWRMDLQNPVPRDQDIFYDIEILRCQALDGDANTDDDSSPTTTIPFKACCLEANYPCQVPASQRGEEVD